MFVAPFLFAALIGYCFLRLFRLTRFIVADYSGYALFLVSALAGVFILAAGRLLMLLAPAGFQEVEAAWIVYAPFEHSGLAACSLVIALVAPPVLNLLCPPRYAFAIATRRRAGRIGLLLHRSLEGAGLVEITLASRKSYIGRIIYLHPWASSGIDVSMIPYMSGYRHQDTLELHVTTYYDRVLEANLSAELLEVSFPYSQIASARPFDLANHALFASTRASVHPTGATPNSDAPAATASPADRQPPP